MSRAAQLALGETIRDNRRALRLKQTELARRANVTPGHLSRLELGTHDPSLSTLKSIASALDLPLGALFGEKTKLTPEGLAFARAFDAAPPDVREATLRLLKGVADLRERS